MIANPKKGDLSLPCNKRVIKFSSIFTKVINRKILNRIWLKVEPHLIPNQNGFRPERCTTAHTLALRRLIEGVKETNLKMKLVFIDFKKVFSSIHRGKMLKVLGGYGISEQIVRTTELIYEGTKAKILSPSGETQFFE